MTTYKLFVFEKNQNYKLIEIVNSNDLTKNLLQGNYVHPIIYKRDGNDSTFTMGLTEIHFLKNSKHSLRDDSVLLKYFQDKDYNVSSTFTSWNGLIDLVNVSSNGHKYLLLIQYLIDNTKLIVQEPASICEFSHNHKTGFSNLTNMTPRTREVTSITTFNVDIAPDGETATVNGEGYTKTDSTSFDNALTANQERSDWFGRNVDNTKTLSVFNNINRNSRDNNTVVVTASSSFKSADTVHGTSLA